jgi:hypothetical protein
MGVQRTSFDKLQRDRAKKAKAAAKRERRQEKGSEEPEENAEPLAPLSAESKLSASELLERVAEIHRRFEAKEMSFEDFEELKAELMSQLVVD